MSAETSAETHALEFHWYRGDPEFSVEEARLHDLLALRNTTTGLIREQRDLLAHYDSDEELFGRDGRATTVDDIVDAAVCSGFCFDRNEVLSACCCSFSALRFGQSMTEPSTSSLLAKWHLVSCSECPKFCRRELIFVAHMGVVTLEGRRCRG